jgi:hypothetical protein
MAMIYREAREDRERLRRMESKLNVSGIPINTSIGISASPYIHTSNTYSVCFTQAQPTYTTANSHAYTHATGAPVCQASVLPSTHTAEPRGQPSLQSIRNDPHIAATAQSYCNELEASQIGTNININNKKARGLMRAGGEASKHLYTDWPHNFVLVGSDKERTTEL